MNLYTLDNWITNKARSLGIPALRISVGIVFLWFGLLKIFGVSPVVGLISVAYPSFPEPGFIIFLGFWEALVGIGLIFKIYLRISILSLWLQMGGVFGSLLTAPSVFFSSGNPLLLTFEGEFLIKNIVLLAATLVVWSYEAVQMRQEDKEIHI